MNRTYPKKPGFDSKSLFLTYKYLRETRFLSLPGSVLMKMHKFTEKFIDKQLSLARYVDKIGYPNVIKFPQYGGDYEYIVRAKKNGFKII